jgi:glycine betaine/choline ABC-type transport system substrate-binding protein
MQKLNYRVDERGHRAHDVAREWLLSERLIRSDAPPNDGSAGIVVIGGKEFTEQDILGHTMAILIESHSHLRTDLRLSLGGTMVCLNALKAGDLDIYPEYTGTALINIVKHDVIADPDRAHKVVKEYFKEEYDILWLEPFGFNNTYTLTMRRAHAEELAIDTISDLAKLLREPR